MHFAVTLPLWGYLGLACALILVAWWTYAGLPIPVSRGRRVMLVALRATALCLIASCLLQPVRDVPQVASGAMVVPVLIDVSRSMRITDQAGESRLAVARRILDVELAPALARFATERWTFGEQFVRADDEWRADARRTDLAGALRAVRDHYRDRRIAGVIVVSDGGETGPTDPADSIADGSLPVFTVGVGAAHVAPDLEIVDMSAGEAAVSESSVDLTVSTVSRGTANAFDIRLLESGRPIDLRRVVPAVDGSPLRVTFTVEPPTGGAALYTVEIPAADGEAVLENNRRSLVLEPPVRTRRVLVVEGAPAFEHSFVKRALASDAGLEVDASVRKGRDAQGAATYFLQGESTRVVNLSTGFPSDAAALNQYDAILLANVEADTLSRSQLEMVVNFVGRRGGGLLVVGARSFERQTLVGTPLEELIPVTLTDPATGIVRGTVPPPALFRAAATAAGLRHPAIRIGLDEADTVSRWRAFPALAGAASLGALRPGAELLAVIATPDGVRPLVAAQRYGQGRTILFTGEASWRWRMQLPSTDRSFERFWRQATRWLASGARGPVTLLPPSAPSPGDVATIEVEVRDAAFAPVRDAVVRLVVTASDGTEQVLTPTLTDPDVGRYAAQFRFDRAGVYRLKVDATRGGRSLGVASAWSLVGGVDREMSDPRLNEDVLRRISRASGGLYVPAADIARLVPLLQERLPAALPPRVEDVWDRAWVFFAAVGLLSIEWSLRRAWGLR